jgi:hypothetical protein
MAVKLVGLQVNNGNETEVGTAFNWLIQAHVNQKDSSGISVDMRELLPEEVMYEVYKAIDEKHKFQKILKCIDKMAENGENRLLPGHPISVQGILKFPEMKEYQGYNPFNPPDLHVNTFLFHGEKCFVGELYSDGFRLPVYFDEAAKEQILFCHDEPIEITGIVRWAPPYSPKGSKSLNLVIRAASLWLQ